MKCPWCDKNTLEWVSVDEYGVPHAGCSSCAWTEEVPPKPCYCRPYERHGIVLNVPCKQHKAHRLE